MPISFVALPRGVRGGGASGGVVDGPTGTRRLAIPKHRLIPLRRGPEEVERRNEQQYQHALNALGSINDERSILPEWLRVRTGRNRFGIDVRDVIAALNPILRGWPLVSHRRRRGEPDRSVCHLAFEAVCCSTSGAGICGRGKLISGRRSGFIGMTCTGFVAPSITPLPEGSVTMSGRSSCAGKPHAQIERGMGKRIRYADTAPLTTNGADQAAGHAVPDPANL